MLPVVFPLVGYTRVRDTFNAPRDGGARVHQGVDLPLLARRVDRNIRYPVRAPVPGEVVRVSHEGPIGEPNQGNAYFIKDDDGWTHLLAHLEAPPPESMVGTRVQAGQFLGFASNTGNARNTGPHLHYHIVDEHGGRVNPTARLALLHAALESQRTPEVRYDTTPSSPRGLPPYVAPLPSNPNLGPHGVGDDTEDDLRPRRTRVQANSGPRPPRTFTAHEVERARESVRAALDMVEREVHAALDVSAWENYAAMAVGGSRTRALVREQWATRDVMAPIILGHLQAAQRLEATAEAAGSSPEAGEAWVGAFEQLTGAHRLTQSLTTPWEALRTDPQAFPLWPVLEAIDMAQGAVEQAMLVNDALAFTMREGWDDFHEDVLPQATDWGQLFLVGAGAYVAWQLMR